MIRVLFDIHHLYYLPQFIPVIQAMNRDQDFMVYYTAHLNNSRQDYNLIRQAVQDLPGEFLAARNEKERRAKILTANFDVTVFGKSRHAEHYCSAKTLAVLLYHGIGVKSCYYTDYHPRIDVRYVESDYRYQELRRREGATALVVTGFPKLDLLFDAQETKALADQLNLDPERPTLLYAPTFYPSSIEIFGDHLSGLTQGYNLVVKLHQFSWTKPKYQHQHRLFQQLSASHEHVYLLPPEVYNIVPLFPLSDLLISEASSTMFEYLATENPAIVCDFFHLRRHHKWFFKRFRKRRLDPEILPHLDFAYHLSDPADLPQLLTEALQDETRRKAVIRERKALFLGPVDGQAAARVVTDLKQRLAARRGETHS